MTYKNAIKSIISSFLALIIGFSPTFTYAEDYRDAGTFSGDGSVYRSSANDYTYTLTNEGGFTVYVPYDHSKSGQEIYTRMFKGLFNIYKSAYGSNYESAGAKFNSGIPTIKGVSTKYFAKTLSIGGISDRVGPVTSSEAATTDLHEFAADYNIEFRYAGVMINRDTKKGSVVTNPAFPADTLSSSSSGGAARTYNRYKKNTDNVFDTVTLYGTASTQVIGWDALVKNYQGSSGIPSNIPSQSPYYDTWEKVFALWAERTEIGAAYKNAYAQNPSGVTWDRYLKDYLRIDGDYRTQSVLLTAVFNYDGHTYYKTYGIPFPIDANMIASKIQILDEKSNVLDYSERPLEFESSINGADQMNKNMGTSGKSAGEPIKLEVGKTYGIELGLTFASKDKKETTTKKNTEAASPEIIVMDTSREENTVTRMGTGITSSLRNLSSTERSLFDSNTSGSIAGKQSFVYPLTRGSDETITYYCGMAGYKNLSFTVQENFPTTGILRFVVPEIYDQNGDNSYRNDDYVELEYTLDETPPPPSVESDAYGDMNLGQRELRSLHYKKIVLEDNPDAPIYATDPVTGEQVETGEYEQMEVEYEYVTDYGTWASYAESPEGEEAGEWNGVPEATGDIYPIDDVSWWEYDQVWPDQSDDAYYKIWLVKNGDTWSPNDEDYYRSETTDYPFTLGFSTSRSRATDNNVEKVVYPF